MAEELLNQKVVLTDATTVTINGKQGYIRNLLHIKYHMLIRENEMHQ